MFDTIYIGTSGLMGHAKGLSLVGNNLANVNTPGFKSAQLQFSDLFSQNTGGGDQQRNGGQGSLGAGLDTLGSKINFKPGADQSTGDALDLSINGNGMYTIRRGDDLLYTRAGDFQFDASNVLTNSRGDHVLGLDSAGKLADINLDGLGTSAPKATSNVKISGNLTSTVAVPPVNASLNNVTIFDPNGVRHTVNLSFKNMGDNSYTVTVTDGVTNGAVLGSGTLQFAAGTPLAEAGIVNFDYASTGVEPFTVALDFSSNVTSQTTVSTLSMASQNGYGTGVRTNQTISSDGTVEVAYSNGQTVKGARLALAQFDSEQDLVQVGGSAFAKQGTSLVHYGFAGADAYGTLVAGHLEGSNVDLASEFSNLILMQRGYQASSHVISTANDMIQQLFDMKGRT